MEVLARRKQAFHRASPRYRIAAYGLIFLFLTACAKAPEVQPTGPTPQLEPPPRGRYDKWFQAYTAIHFQHLISPRWPKGVAIAESALNFRAESSVGAIGLMQFMPTTWTWIAPEPWRSRGALDPEAAIWVGCYYLRWNWDRLPTPGDLHHKAMVNAAYNSGLGNVQKARAKCSAKSGCDPNTWDGNVEASLVTRQSAQDETINYVRRIRKFENQLLIAGEFL